MAINENNYDIVDRYNNPIIFPNKIINSKINFIDYKYISNDENIKIENKVFGIRIKHKIKNNIIIVQVGFCKLKKENLIREGYYIINLIPENYKINCYGLYNNYFAESDHHHRREHSFIVSKPLEYKNQFNKYKNNYFDNFKENVSKEDKDYRNIDDKDYYFIAHLSKDKFIIKELIKEDLLNNNEDPYFLPGLAGGENKFLEYKNKYLKYKNKYLKYKNKYLEKCVF